MKYSLRQLVENVIKEEMSLYEKKKPKEEEIEIEEPIEVEDEFADESNIDNEPPNMELNSSDPVEKRIGTGLQMALEASKELPDSFENKTKLIRQIGNTALFFLKTQIPGDGTSI